MHNFGVELLLEDENQMGTNMKHEDETWISNFRQSFWHSAMGETIEFVQLGCTVLGMVAYYPVYRMKECASQESNLDQRHGRGKATPRSNVTVSSSSARTARTDAEGQQSGMYP